MLPIVSVRTDSLRPASVVVGSVGHMLDPMHRRPVIAGRPLDWSA